MLGNNTFDLIKMVKNHADILSAIFDYFIQKLNEFVNILISSLNKDLTYV